MIKKATLSGGSSTFTGGTVTGDIIPSGSVALGSSGSYFADGYISTFQTEYIGGTHASDPLYLKSENVADGATAVGVEIDTTNAFSNAAAVICRFKTGGSTKLDVGKAGSLTPGSDNTADLGSTSVYFANAYANTFKGSTFVGKSTSATMQFTSSWTDSASTDGFTFTTAALSTSGANIAKFKNNTTVAVRIDKVGSVIPGTTLTSDLGTASLLWTNIYANNVYATLWGNTTATIKSANADGAGSIAGCTDSFFSFTTAGAKIHSFKTGGSEKAFIDKDGQYEGKGTGKGIILVSPDGTRYLLTIANGGTVSITAA